MEILKKHEFVYLLYPHRGINVVGNSNVKLPRIKSFIEIDNKNIIIEAV